MFSRFTVVQRIAGGFAVLAALLVAVGGSGLIGLSRVDGALKSVASAAHIRIDSQTLTVRLLEVGRLVDTYHASRDPEKLPELQSRFESLSRQIGASGDSGGDPELVEAVNALHGLLGEVTSTASQTLKAHGEYVAKFKATEKARGALEDSADELDAALADQLDKGGANRAAIAKLKKDVKQGVIAATDALQRPQLAGARIAAKDLAAQAQDLAGEAKALHGADALSSSVEHYVGLLAGPDAALTHFVSGLESEERADKLLAGLNQKIEATRRKLGELDALAEHRTDESLKAGLATGTTASIAMALIGLVALGLAGATAWFVTLSIRSPLEKVVTQLKLVAGGDMTQHVRIAGSDEFANLGRWVNELTDKLRDMLKEVTQDAARLAAASEHTAAVTQQTNAGIAQQKNRTDEMVDAMHEMSRSVDAVADSAGRTLDEIRSARSVAEQGRAVISSNLETIHSLAENIESAAEVVGRVDDYSEQIGRVVDVIRDVTEQTNLLALNAAIEAARAGEAGRGFAVVADEVRTLASRTRESTAAIQKTIEQLQGGVQEAVQAMQASRERTQASVSEAGEAGEALAAILESMRCVDQMSESIAEAALAQRQVTQGLNRNVDEIGSIAEQTASGSQSTASSARELAALADRLQQMVVQFRV
ncbi:methyl-accepting chemotaxis protein [Niveibacterium terrae]|uniref:methyl-accepting chemotaxis protein n=1 Tax=Niveibacterium terrae TaxID=3373598 RepID=UPI003A925418